jgi:hypothetical protein
MWMYAEINLNSCESKVTLLWSRQVKTVRTVPSSQLDIVIFANEKGMSLWMYIAISEDRNVIKKEAEKILYCKDLIIEIQHMWNIRTKLYW